MRKLSKKDIAVWAIVVVVVIPSLLVFNENMEAWYINVAGLAYIALLAKACKTNIGKMFLKRLGKIEDKLFGKVGG